MFLTKQDSFQRSASTQAVVSEHDALSRFLTDLRSRYGSTRNSTSFLIAFQKPASSAELTSVFNWLLWSYHSRSVSLYVLLTSLPYLLVLLPLQSPRCSCSGCQESSRICKCPARCMYAEHTLSEFG